MSDDEATQVVGAPLMYYARLRTKVNRYPAYNQLLRLGRERPGALFLDIGCGVGNDVRRAVSDGFPAKQIIASDLHPGMYIAVLRASQ